MTLNIIDENNTWDYGDFSVTNFGSMFYHPPKSMTKGLRKIIIFTENAVKHDIPNGSVFVYDANVEFKPEILSTDVGCGITGMITEKISFDKKNRKEILRVVDELGIHIGQGNHFLNFTTPYPVLRRKKIPSNMIFLHSDFNNDNLVPCNYEEAKNIENTAKEKRREYLDKLSDKLGIKSDFYHDWVHNSVNIEDGEMVYRKGSINLKETAGIGVLALNPVEGVFLYAGLFDELYSSMQHGTGRKGSTSELMKNFSKESYGMARGFSFAGPDPYFDDLEDVMYKVYNPMKIFVQNFVLKISIIGTCANSFFVTTKGT